MVLHPITCSGFIEGLSKKEVNGLKIVIQWLEDCDGWHTECAKPVSPSMAAELSGRQGAVLKHPLQLACCYYSKTRPVDQVFPHPLLELFSRIA